MLLGVMGDTHDVDESIIFKIARDLQNRGAQMIINPGDIEKQHLRTDLFSGLPVVCALTRQQQFDPAFTFPPPGWVYTRPGNSMISEQDKMNEVMANTIASKLAIANRIVHLGEVVVYVGHERSADVLKNAPKFNEFINLLNQVYDGVRFVFTGHTRHQFLIQRSGFSWINPGSVWPMFFDYEYALVNTVNGEIVFTRLPQTVTNIKPQTVGIISDTGNISDRDSQFWCQLAIEFRERDVSVVIIDGSFSPADIGRPELENFQVFYNLLSDDADKSDKPANWHLIPSHNPVLEICSHYFLIQHKLGLDLDGKTEVEMIDLIRDQSKRYRHIDIVICGSIHDALFEEQQEVMIINPGDARNHRKFVTICFPRCEVTFSTVRLGENRT